jgi:hypothetical protein
MFPKSNISANEIVSFIIHLNINNKKEINNVKVHEETGLES